MNKFAYIALVFGAAKAIKLQSDFITDEQYAEQHAHALYEKANPMNDDIEDDHMIQTDTKIQFVTDAQWKYISHAQSNQRWVELPNCAADQYGNAAADASLPIHTGDGVDDGAYYTNSAATCKPGTEWTNTVEATAPRGGGGALVQTNQRWVELPNCAKDQYGNAAADPSLPIHTGDGVDDGAHYSNSAATCKPGTEW